MKLFPQNKHFLIDKQITNKIQLFKWFIKTFMTMCHNSVF